MRVFIGIIIILIMFTTIANAAEAIDQNYNEFIEFIIEVDPYEESAVAGFIGYLKDNYDLETENYSKDRIEFLKAGLEKMMRTFRDSMIKNIDENKILDEMNAQAISLGSIISDFNCDYESDCNSRSTESIALAAETARENSEKKGKWMYVHNMQTWNIDTGGWKDGVKYPGMYSCALVVSAIMKKAGHDIGKIQLVTEVASTLKEKGWEEVSKNNLKKGDVIVWKNNGGRHIGIYVGSGMAVSNHSYQGKPSTHNAKSSQGGKPISFVLRMQ